MELKEITYRKSIYFLMLLLIMLSGSPAFAFLPETRFVILSFIIIIYICIKKSIHEYKDIYKYGFMLLLIFISQYFIFSWNTFPGIINFLAKLLIGGFVYNLLREKFKYYYLKVISHLSVVALFFWVLQVFLDLTFHLNIFPGESNNIIIYYNSFREPLRNCGPFWEPGAFGCYIVLAFLMFVDQLLWLWTNNKKICLILFVTLLTTQSTTAYFAFAIFVLLYLFFNLQSKKKYLLLPICMVTFFYIYENTAFLGAKLKMQTESAVNAEGDFDSSRLGSLIFDLYYIKKHPLVGNGLHEKTRYADHPYLEEEWSRGEIARSGNGFSDFLAKMGLMYYVFLIYFFIRTNQFIKKSSNFIFLFILFLLLQGEPLFNYPLVLAIPFLRLEAIKI